MNTKQRDFSRAVTVYLPASLALQLSRQARLQGKSVSAAVREAARSWLSKTQAEEAQP